MKRSLYLFTLITTGMCWLQPTAFAAPLIHSSLPSKSAIKLLAVFTIKGSVVDDGGVALPGVTINVKGTNIRAVTDERGNFTIQAPSGVVSLVFTYIGFNSQEVAVKSQSLINVKLVPKTSAMNEVVVVGYGTQKQRDITGSISSLKSDDIDKYNSPTFQTAMQGRMAGVEMNESSGVPGSAVNVRIRGLNTINGGAGPLYIVDGIPIITGAGGDGDSPMTNNNVSGVESNPLTDINPNDIASVEVLKDAAATAIYGARGGGGVILITTKRAQKGKTIFSLRLSSGIEQISKRPSLLNGPQILTIFDEAYRNTFNSVAANAGLPVPATPFTTGLTGFDRGMADTTDVNHLQDVLRLGIYQEVNFTAANGTDKTKFYLSGLYRHTQPTFRGTDIFQYSMRLNIDHDFNDNIKIGASIAPSFSNEYRLGSGPASSVGGYGAAITTNLPIYPNYNADGTFFNPYNNALAFLSRNLYTNNQRRLNIIGAAYLEAKISKELTFRTNVQRQDFNQIANAYTAGILRLTTAASTISPFIGDQLALASQQNSFGYSNSLESYFTYNKTFAKAHSINTVLGMRFSKTDILYEALYGENFANSSQVYPSESASIMNNFQTGAQGDPSAVLGYFFRTNYKYKNRYLVGLVVNRDGSSRFGTSKRYGTFPALSLGWIASDESFMKKNPVLSFLKLRGSAGLTGNAQGIANTAAKSTYLNALNGVGTYKNDVGSIPNQPANADLHWEQGVKFDAGIDFGFLNDRITSTFDFYHYTTNELLLSIPVPVTFGYGNQAVQVSYVENRGSLINKGVEFSVSSNNLIGKFKWKTTFNISHNATHIVSLGGLTSDQLAAGNNNAQLVEGHDGPVFSLIEWVGVDPATGGELIRDKNNNVVLASTLNAQQLSDARKPQFDKMPYPKFYGGLGNNFSYKDFTLSVFFSYRYGNYLLDAGQRTKEYVGDYTIINSGNTINIGNLSTTILNRWTTPGQVTDVPKLFYIDPTNDVLRTLNTTRFLSDASYIRLKTIDLAYTIPVKFIKRLGLRSAAINVTAQNLLLFTKFKGMDPEAQTIVANNYRERNLAYGIINNALPLPKTLVLGVNIGF